MRQMTDAQIERWGTTRAGGKKRFIWLQGVLGWGVLTAVLVALLQKWLGPDTHHFGKDLLIGLIIYPIGGYFWGWSMWALTERSYSKTLALKTDAARGA